MQKLQEVKWGLAGVLLCLMLGIGMGLSFGVAEDAYQGYIAAGIAAHPQLHDAASQGAIWRWALRAHFHAAGIGGFGLGLVLLVAVSGLSAAHKRWVAALIALGGLYPLAWLSMFLLAPSLGRAGARQHWLVEAFTYISLGGLLLGLLLLVVGLLRDQAEPAAG
jgi:hypothetical protein